MSARYLLCLLLAGCPSGGNEPPPLPETEDTPPPAAPRPPYSCAAARSEAFEAPTVCFAVIGDFGDDDDDAHAVADLVRRMGPDFIVTVGDNNYPDGDPDTWDLHVGKPYHRFLGDYRGRFGPGSAENRFWPVPGNHDYHDGSLGPYLDFFSLPGNERYYAKDYGLVHLFALSSDPREPDGNAADSAQAGWLRAGLAGSRACYDVVSLHHPPYSSGRHGSAPTLRWPFAAWGADVVIAGHSHHYERLEVDGFPYFVNGLGGRDRGDLQAPLPETRIRYASGFGAMRVFATPRAMRLEFWTTAGEKIDERFVRAQCPSGGVPR